MVTDNFTKVCGSQMSFCPAREKLLCIRMQPEVVCTWKRSLMWVPRSSRQTIRSIPSFVISTFSKIPLSKWYLPLDWNLNQFSDIIRSMSKLCHIHCFNPNVKTINESEISQEYTALCGVSAYLDSGYIGKFLMYNVCLSLYINFNYHHHYQILKIFSEIEGQIKTW